MTKKKMKLPVTDVRPYVKRIKELEAVNDILWEYIWEKDYEEIRKKIDKIDD